MILIPSSVFRKSITIPVGTYKKLVEFKEENEIFSHFCARVFESFLETRNNRYLTIPKIMFTELLRRYPKDEEVKKLSAILVLQLEDFVNKRLKDMKFEREVLPHLKKVLVDVNNIFTAFSYNLLDNDEFQIVATHKSTGEYIDFWADVLIGFFNGYDVVEQEKKNEYLYIHFKKY